MTASKAERMDMRLSTQQKRLIEQGAALKGLSTSDFVIQSAAQAAEQLIYDQQIINLSLEGQRAFLAALESPPQPNETLKEAAKFYKANVVDEFDIQS